MPLQTISIRVLAADGAQSDVTIVQGTAGKKIRIWRATATADGSNMGPTNIKLGFAISAVAITTPNVSTGAGIILDLLGVSAGGGVTAGDGSGVLGIGAVAASLKYTCEEPTGGAITLTATYDELAL